MLNVEREQAMYKYLIQDQMCNPLFYATTANAALSVLTFNLSVVGYYRYNNGRIIRLSDAQVLMEWKGKQFDNTNMQGMIK